MAARSKARKRAVDVLYEADVRGSDPLELLRERVALASPPIPDHAVRLVEGVAEHADRIDELIDRHAHGWSIDRLPDVDRAILRMAVFELLWVDDVPDPRPSSAVTSTTKIVLNLESLGSLPADEAGPLARYASTIQAQRHDYNGKVLSIRAEDLKSLAIIYDMSPDELTSRLIEWGVLSPGMESVVGFGGDEDEDEVNPNWERRRTPR